MSSAILYGAIVVIWAGVLIPRWLRRESSSEEATVTTEAFTAPETVETPDATGVSEADGADDVEGDEDDAGRRTSEHARIVAARRRLLGMLIALAVAAEVLAQMKLAAWWVVLPPTVMLVGYLALLREASRADAERAEARRARHAAAARAATGGSGAPEASAEITVAVDVAGPVAPDAEVIDITGRVGEEFYDQYADKLRAVGD